MTRVGAVYSPYHNAPEALRGAVEVAEAAGVRAASPLTLMREYLPALRSLLAGQEVTVSGRYVTLDAVRLDWLPKTPPPIYAAGQGQRRWRWPVRSPTARSWCPG